jgi:hypothetical protein
LAAIGIRPLLQERAEPGHGHDSDNRSNKIASWHFFQETTMNKICAGALIAACAVAVTLFAVHIAPRAEAQAPAGPGKAQATPILSGKLVGVDVWTSVPEKGSTASARPTQGRVEVYEHFMVIISPDGERSLYTNGWYANLRFRAV